MSGFSYQMRFRAVPDVGAPVIYDLTTLNPTQGPVSSLISYSPEKVSRPTPARRILEKRFGWRPNAALKFELSDLSEEQKLAEIATFLMRDDAHVYLSTDGGVNEREVVLDSDYVRDPLGGKTIAGVSVDLALRAVDLAPNVPAMNSTYGTPAERLLDGGFEQWLSATSPTQWTKDFQDAGLLSTLNRDAAAQRSGTYCARIDRLAAGYLDLHQTFVGLLPAVSYALSLPVKASASGVSGYSIVLRNLTANKDVAADGVTWQAPGVNLLSAVQVSLGYTVATVSVTTLSTFLAGDQYKLFVVINLTTGQSLYLDDFSLFGPTSPIGLARW